MNINNVIIGGNLVRDPEFKNVDGARCVAEFTIASNRKYRKDGEVCEDVAFVSVVAWNRLAETCRDYLRKGMPVVVVGSLVQERWEKNGQKKSKTRVRAESVQFLHSRSDDR